MNTFFTEIQNINSKNVKNKFEEIYWKCPDLIIHIELNFRYLYLKDQKNIDKYYENKKNELFKNLNLKPNEIGDKYNSLQKKYEEDVCSDRYLLINSFLNGELSSKDYEPDKIKDEYIKLVPQNFIEEATEKEMEEINQNSIKFLNNLLEYKNYLKFQYILEKYQKKEQHKNAFNTTRKEIAFDLFLRVDQPTTVYMTKTSNVTFSSDDNGLKNAARVAFITEGHLAGDQAPQI